MGIFGKNLEKRIMFMITFCDGGKPQCIDALTAAGLPINKYFKFNNSALMETEADEFTEGFWNMGMKSMTDFFDFISISDPISLNQTKKTLENRALLMDRANALERDMQATLGASDELKSLLVQVSKNQAAIDANQNVTITVNKQANYDVRTGPNHTRCNICQQLCHENCAFGDGDDKKNCCMMNSNGHCTKSGCGHFWQSHTNYRFTETKTRHWTEQVESKTLIAALGGFQKDKSQTQALIDNFKLKLLEKISEIGQSIIKITEINKELDKIALKKQPFSDTTFFDQLIAEEKQNKREGYLQRVESYTMYKQRIELTQKAATGMLDLQTFITLNKDELDNLGMDDLKKLTNDQERKKRVEEGKCAVM